MGAVELVIYAGYEAMEAGDADEAILIIESKDEIDLVFTDVQMPGMMDGLKLSHYIRDRLPPVKLIIASGAGVLAESLLPGGKPVLRQALRRSYEHTSTETMAPPAGE